MTLNPFKQNTRNKIAFCQKCTGTLTDFQAKAGYCNQDCEDKKYDFEMAREKGRETIWVYLNKNMLDLAQSEKVIPFQYSHFFWSNHELVGVAKFVKEELEGIGDHETNVYDAWWREIGRMNEGFKEIGGKHHRPRIMRKVGILSYLCDEYGISTEKNIALAIGEITEEELYNDPLELINSL